METERRAETLDAPQDDRRKDVVRGGRLDHQHPHHQQQGSVCRSSSSSSSSSSAGRAEGAFSGDPPTISPGASVSPRESSGLGPRRRRRRRSNESAQRERHTQRQREREREQLQTLKTQQSNFLLCPACPCPPDITSDISSVLSSHTENTTGDELLFAAAHRTVEARNTVMPTTSSHAQLTRASHFRSAFTTHVVYRDCGEPRTEPQTFAPNCTPTALSTRVLNILVILRPPSAGWNDKKKLLRNEGHVLQASSRPNLQFTVKLNVISETNYPAGFAFRAVVDPSFRSHQHRPALCGGATFPLLGTSLHVGGSFAS
ncbi:hypothetical protein Q8A73_011428 [Channa argus]|nr:hypothetical protein Q8A73_011428 [Channa argus]